MIINYNKKYIKYKYKYLKLKGGFNYTNNLDELETNLDELENIINLLIIKSDDPKFSYIYNIIVKNILPYFSLKDLKLFGKMMIDFKKSINKLINLKKNNFEYSNFQVQNEFNHITDKINKYIDIDLQLFFFEINKEILNFIIDLIDLKNSQKKFSENTQEYLEFVWNYIQAKTIKKDFYLNCNDFENINIKPLKERILNLIENKLIYSKKNTLKYKINDLNENELIKKIIFNIVFDLNIYDFVNLYYPEINCKFKISLINIFPFINKEIIKDYLIKNLTIEKIFKLSYNNFKINI